LLKSICCEQKIENAHPGITRSIPPPPFSGFLELRRGGIERTLKILKKHPPKSAPAAGYPKGNIVVFFKFLLFLVKIHREYN